MLEIIKKEYDILNFADLIDCESFRNKLILTYKIKKTGEIFFADDIEIPFGENKDEYLIKMSRNYIKTKIYNIYYA